MARIRDDKGIVRSLDEIIVREREAGALLDQPSFAIECKQLLPIHVGVLPMTGFQMECCCHSFTKGPYQALGLSYERLLQHVRTHQHTMLLPPPEVYLKGPGMIFRGNPKIYLTEILLPIED
ncbi:MAG: hypothetical protein R3F19_11660 [Verrucomicrobiales bacterium]